MSRILSFLCFKFSWKDRTTKDSLNLKDVQIAQPTQPHSTPFLPEMPAIRVVVTDANDNDSSVQGLNPAAPSAPLQRVPSTASSTREQAVQYGVLAVKAIMPLGELCGPFKASLGLLLGALERMDKMYTNDAEFKDMMDQLVTIAGIVPMEEDIDADTDEYERKLHKIASTLNGKIMELGQELTENMTRNGIIQADKVANVIANTKSRLGAHIQEAQLSLNFLQVTLQVQDMRARKTAERERRALRDGDLSAMTSSPTGSLIVKRERKPLNLEQFEDPGPRILPGTSISPPTPVETVSAPTERPSYVSAKEASQSSSIILRPVETRIPQDMVRGSPAASDVVDERSVRRPNDIPFFDLYGEVIWVPYYVALTSANFLLFVQTVLFSQNNVRSRIHQRVLQRPDAFFIVSSTGWPASLSTQISIFVRRRWVLLPGKSFPGFLDLLGSSTWDTALGPLLDWAKQIPISMAESHIDWERQPDRVISESFVSDSSLSSAGDPKTEFSMHWTILTNDMAINPLISETQKFNEFVIVDPTCTSRVYYQTDMSAARKLSVVVIGGIVAASSHIGQGDTHELAGALYSEALRSQIG